MPIKLHRTIRHVAGATVFLAGLAVTIRAQERDRSKIPEQYKWDLTALYPTDQAWRSQKEKLVAELPKLREFQGKLASSAQQLADALETQSRLEKELKRLSVYAGLISGQDTRVSAYQEIQQEMIQLGSTFGAETAYIEPEILKMGNATIDRFITQSRASRFTGTIWMTSRGVARTP